ncbi:TIGR04282 family arsenosugar biosynthesis glycosyltransferase [Streptomyces sp. SCSIO 30461]|uniref:TIGR04282 family arsenosugar biosynthesis glycosyltransferase n=1 Tax=Streptomyces sp. SCSIO 30461 TaxID=3118085 RepID=UPI0030CA9AA4
MSTLLVIAKQPVPGRVKTRLTPFYTPEQAAALAEAALADTLRAVRATPAGRRVLVLDGVPGAWLPDGIDVVPQVAGGLDERLAAAFASCSGTALLVGMDTPQVTPRLLAHGLELARSGAAIGPAEDGGFWALGLAEPNPELLLGVPMSVAETGAVLRRRLVTAGLTVGELPRLRDVDTPGDVPRVAAQTPRSRFSAAAAQLTGSGVR